MSEHRPEANSTHCRYCGAHPNEWHQPCSPQRVEKAVAEIDAEIASKRDTRWLIVRRSSLPGGYRVVQHGLTREQAERQVAQYSSPLEAMSEKRLLELRMDALRPAPAQVGLDGPFEMETPAEGQT